jgi:hypothetical protein
MSLLPSWRQPTQTDIEEGAAAIVDTIAKGQPFLVGRNGTVETETLYFYLTRRLPHAECDAPPYPDHIRFQMQLNAGVFPGTEEDLDSWAAAYLESMPALDVTAAGWYKPLFSVELGMLGRYAREARRTPLRSLEPYYVRPELWWTQALAGKSICVVSSFAQTIQRQLEGAAAKKIWRGAQAGLLDISGASWSYVRTGYAPSLAQGRGGWPQGVQNWRDAVDKLEREVVATGATVALIGCGGLGMILGARLKRRGVSAIILGGAVQVLFGIKGRRWANHEIISKFWNANWVWPAVDEVPGGAQFVEGGCYWG